MPSEPVYAVAIVVDPEFGEQLRALPDRMPVWIADTALNRAAANRLRQERPGRTHLDGVTTFLVGAGETPASWCASILSTVDLHHGQYSHQPPYDAVEVIGAVLDAELRVAFADYGFPIFEPRANGFRARAG